MVSSAAMVSNHGTPSMLISICIIEIVMRKGQKNKKEAGIGPLLKNQKICSKSALHLFELAVYSIDMTFFALICCKIVLFVWKRPKINDKRLGLAHFLKKPKKCLLKHG